MTTVSEGQLRRDRVSGTLYIVLEDLSCRDDIYDWRLLYFGGLGTRTWRCLEQGIMDDELVSDCPEDPK